MTDTNITTEFQSDLPGFSEDQMYFIKTNLVSTEETPRQVLLLSTKSLPPTPTQSWCFKARLFGRDGELLEALGRSITTIDVDFAESVIDVVIRDSADGAVMKTFVQGYGDKRKDAVGSIEVATNPEAPEHPVIRYAISRVVKHTLSYDYAGKGTLEHVLRFEFDSFGIV